MTEPTQGDVVWLTQAKYDQLQAELEHLRGPGRAEVVKKVSDARDEGDLKENGGYHAAREELGKIDGGSSSSSTCSSVPRWARPPPTTASSSPA